MLSDSQLQLRSPLLLPRVPRVREIYSRVESILHFTGSAHIQWSAHGVLRVLALRLAMPIAAVTRRSYGYIEGRGTVREIDVNAVRETVIALNNLTRTDDIYTFYYDETNNIRRFHVTANGFNVKEPMCFVLGGIAHRGPPRMLNIASLKKAVRLQASASELKLSHLGKGDFFNLLGSWRIEVFLDWLKAENLLLHYSAVDPLYWSTVDIVESIISHAALSRFQPMHMVLKADLFTVLACDVDDVAGLFRRYHYPDVGEANRMAFITDLLQRLEEREASLDEFGFQMLKGVLQAGAKADPLIYLENEVPGTLIDSFVEFFLHRLCLFKNAVHLLDMETVIQDRLKACVFRDGGRCLDTFRFVDSQAEPGVQASDALVGLLGKLFSYATRASPAQLIADRRALTPDQARTLAKLNALLDQSNEETSALLHQVASIKAMRGGQFFLEGR